MTCNSCQQGEMVPTQVPRVSQGLGKLGYTIAIGAVLIVGAGVGVGLAVALDGGVDLEWALVATPVILAVSTPLVLFGAMRAFAEKKVWRCRECSSVVDRV